tara:strand:- start:3912 stop:4094 length:183 start_codon:yes stop_codon:yes gene_type:complete
VLDFLKKFLICSFGYVIREKSTGEMHPDRNPQGLVPRGFLRLNEEKGTDLFFDAGGNLKQ